MNRIVIIPKDDLVFYPPTLSLITILLHLGKEVVCVGEYSDKESKKALEQAGVKFVPIFRDLKDVSKNRLINWLVVLLRMKSYQRKVKRFLLSSDITKNDLVWFIYSNSIGYLEEYIERYNYVVQFYEFEDFSLGGKGRLLHPRYDAHRFLSKAKALIHCEYNRAMITNGLYGINTEPFILPNKPYEDAKEQSIVIPEDISRIISDIKDRVNEKKVVLYQGIFDPNERRLNEFCEAMAILPEDFVFIAMGGGGGYFDEMKKRYENDRILFIPFIRPPHHLQITKMARYGVLTYHPADHSYAGVINPLYCAPNKIFEFGKFGIPMVANEAPGLKMIFETYHCGKTVTPPETPHKIASVIMAMEAQYNTMSRGSRTYYDSVDLKDIVKKIVEC